MFWLVNLCFFLIISTGSSNIEFTKTLQINYKDDENLQVTVKFQNPVSYFKYAKIEYACTNDIIATCKFDDSGDQKHLNFNLSKLINIYDKADVNVYFSDINHYQLSSKILLQLVYDPKRSEEPHECLVHCIINFDIKNVFHESQSTNVEKQNEESAKSHKFIKKLVNFSNETEISNNRPTTRIMKLFSNISTYYYFPNAKLTLKCNGFNFSLENSLLVLCKETYVGNTTITEDNENTNNYLAYALEALLAVIGILLLSIILFYWRKSRAAHSAAPENDVYTYATSQLTYAQLQLNAHEGKNRQVTESVPYGTIVGVLKPKT